MSEKKASKAPSRARFLRAITDMLAAKDAPRLIDLDGLRRIYNEARGAVYGEAPRELAEHIMLRFIETLARAGLVGRVQRNLYVNRGAQPSVTRAEVASALREGAIVTMGTVLGDAGIANNPSRVITAIFPSSSPHFVKKRNVDSEDFGEFRFIAMNDAIVTAGSSADNLDPNFSYPRATPERALCDWLYFSSVGGRGQLPPPPLDMDIDDLDMARLQRIAGAMGVADALSAWLARKSKHDEDPDNAAQTSSKLGF